MSVTGIAHGSMLSSLPVLLAQTGTTKTLIGWVIVLLCIGLGVLVICRPAARAAGAKKTPAAKPKVQSGGH
jgi:hypothetical protein